MDDMICLSLNETNHIILRIVENDSTLRQK